MAGGTLSEEKGRGSGGRDSMRGDKQWGSISDGKVEGKKEINDFKQFQSCNKIMGRYIPQLPV